MALTQIPIELSSTPGIVDNSNATAITIDSSENVLVGTTDTAPGAGDTNEGFSINSSRVFVSRASDYSLSLNRTTDDGPIALFRKDGTTVGSIAVASGNNLAIDGLVASHAGLEFGTGRITPRVAGATADNAVDLGYSTQRFQDLYLSGGAYLGGTGSANYLDDYEEGVFGTTFTPSSGGSITLNGTYNNMYYTKIGRVVICTGYFVVSSVSSPTGVLAISLPFPAKNVVNNSSSVYAAFNGMSGGSLSEIWGIIDTNSSAAKFYYGAGSSVASTVSNNVVTSTDVRFQATYIVD